MSGEVLMPAEAAVPPAAAGSSPPPPRFAAPGEPVPGGAGVADARQGPQRRAAPEIRDRPPDGGGG